MKNKKKKIAIFVLFLILLLIILMSLNTGSTGDGYRKLYEAFIKGENSGYRKILMTVRIPRIAVALITGVNLAVSGALLQSVMRNPLADPSIIGVSSGASLAAISTMFIFPQFMSLLPVFAFIGGIAAFILVYTFAWKNGIRPLRIILSGIAVNGIFGGITNGIGLLNTEKLPSLMLWTNGSISSKGWNDIVILAVISLVCIILAFLAAENCNILLLGDETALGLGIEPNRNRIMISMIAVALSSISTAYVGIISFAGLIVPHICRLIVGSDYKYLLPSSVLLGGILILGSDTFTRAAFSGMEIPVGILMSIVGGPFFLYLLRRSNI